MKIIIPLFMAFFATSRANPLDEIVLNPDFIIEVTESAQGLNPHAISYDGAKKLKIPIGNLVDLRNKKYDRQIIIGKFSEKNENIHVIKINKFEISGNKVLVPSSEDGLIYLLDRETLLRILGGEIIINWDKWSDLGGKAVN